MSLLTNTKKNIKINPAFLAAILANETGWTPPEAFIQNPTLKNHGTIAGPFQFDTRYIARYTSDLTLDGDHDGTVDVQNPADSAYMAAAFLKSMGAGMDTPLGEPNDYTVARNNEDGKVTIRTIAAHYNQGGGWSSDRAVQGNNDVNRYMDQAMTITDAIRQSHFFSGVTGSTPASSGCSDPSANAAISKSFAVYSQYDARWANNLYGTYSDGSRGTIASSGCGPTAMAMIITFLRGESVFPNQTALYASQNGAEDNNGGSLSIIATTLAANPRWKLNVNPIELDANQMATAMNSGGLIIIAGRSGSDPSMPSPYTSGGHYIVIRGVTASGKWVIGDSNIPENNTKEFDPAAILSGAVKESAYVLTKAATADQ
jgi:hypothetical protein